MMILWGIIMSQCDINSYWRCPNCSTENKYNLTWQHYYVFNEMPNNEYSKEKCSCCGKEYYVDKSEPNPYCFRMNRGRCKNDYIKDMVIEINTNLTICNEYYTT